MQTDRIRMVRRTAALLAASLLAMTAGPAAAQAPPPAMLELIPASGESPATTTANGTGFTGFGAVEFTINESVIGTAEPDGKGNVTLEVTIAGAPGAQIVKACQADADGAPCMVTASASFVILAPPTTTLPPTTTTLPPTTTTTLPPTTTTSTVAAVAPIVPQTSPPVTTLPPVDSGDIGAEPATTDSVADILQKVVVLCVIVGGAALLWFGVRRFRARPPQRPLQTLSNTSKMHGDSPPGAHIEPSQTKVKLLAPDAGPSAPTSHSGPELIEIGPITYGPEAGGAGGTEDLNIGMGELETTEAADPEKLGRVKSKFHWDHAGDAAGGEKGGTEDLNIGVGELQESTGTELQDIGVPQAESTNLGERVMQPDYGAGMNEAPGTELQDIGAPEAEAEGWDPATKEKIEGQANPPAESTGTELEDIGEAQESEAPGTELEDIGDA